MSCSHCRRLDGIEQALEEVGVNDQRQAHLFMCRRCRRTFELQALDWGGPQEVDRAFVAVHYGEAVLEQIPP